MKLRLPNASHQALTYFGYLMGCRRVHEATSDPLIASFLLRYMNEEATPTLHPVPGVDLDADKKTLIERFSNPAVRDTIARLCAESSSHADVARRDGLRVRLRGRNVPRALLRGEAREEVMGCGDARGVCAFREM